MTMDDAMSRVSKYSKRSGVPRSEISRVTNKTYISHLES
jgi:predicted  nucleic acid-binding Zn-ribbon protein